MDGNRSSPIHNSRVIRNRAEGSRGMRSHSRAIHSSKAIPSRIIPSRVTDNSRAIHPKVEGIKIIRNRGMANSKDTLNKVMHNKDTGSNRAMDNHLPGKTCRPGNCP